MGQGMRLLGKWQHRLSTREESLQTWKQELVYLGHVISAQISNHMSTALVLMCIRLLEQPASQCARNQIHTSGLPKGTVSFSAPTPGLPFLSFLERGRLKSRSLPLQGT